MALKNTFIKKHMTAGNYMSSAQEALVKAGADGIQFGYEDGRVTSLVFTLKMSGKPLSFKLPVNWKKFQNVLKKENNPKSGDDEYCYRVAWACTKDWIEAQMAFVESENVTVPQVFLPYVIVKDGKTLFEEVDKGKFLLNSGQ